MYTPRHFQNTNTAEIKNFIRQNGFGILITNQTGKIRATHIPLEFTDKDRKLVGHISKGNPQWKEFSEQDEVLVIFNGPHTYISSSWYNHENVPTWNYIAAHVYGTLKILADDAVLESLKALVDKYESASTEPVHVENLSPDYLKRSLAGIVGFEISISRIEATYKLSQNRDDENHKNVIYELEKKEGDENALRIAEAMKNNRCPIGKP